MLGAMALVGCLDTTAATPVPVAGSNPATETFAANLGVNIAQMTKTVNGTYFKDITLGTGTPLTAPPATQNTLVAFTYIGWLKNGTVFDSGTVTLANQVPLGGLIGGFTDGILGMNIGGDRLLVIPSDNAYGNSTKQTKFTIIPSNSTLVFRIKLTAIQ